MDPRNYIQDLVDKAKYYVYKKSSTVACNPTYRRHETGKIYAFGDYYYETPDGQDCDTKMYLLTYISARIAIPASMLASIMFAPARPFPRHLQYVLKNTVIFGVAGGAYSGISCTMAHLRGEERRRDHMVAGFFTSYLLCYMKKVNPFMTVWSMVFGGLFAGLIKDANMCGIWLWPAWEYTQKKRGYQDYGRNLFHDRFEDKLNMVFDHFVVGIRARQFGIHEEDFDKFKADD